MSRARRFLRDLARRDIARREGLTAEELAAAVAQLPRGRVALVTVLHDLACSPLGCRCVPRFRVQIATPDAVAVAAEAHRAWTKESLS